MTNSILLQAGGGGFGIENIVFLALIGLIFYFFMIRPQQKKAKDAKTFMESIKKGDEVVTIGGLHGRVHTVDTDTFILEVDRGMKLKVEKSAISHDFTKKTDVKK
ncbi:preprotein translocase subunit YajC [Litoribacter populi]|uniref:preprotein translocase subunit YajC n=1 Tax=Litoribacter populi TaxID=2598460 RepID=UPI00117D1D50|nr:preprotein translocase subunit YajC [Litoribacter populi]